MAGLPGASYLFSSIESEILLQRPRLKSAREAILYKNKTTKEHVCMMRVAQDIVKSFEKESEVDEP